MIKEPLAGIVTLAMAVCSAMPCRAAFQHPDRDWTSSVGPCGARRCLYGRDTRVVPAFGLAIFANSLLMSLMFGALLGVFIRNQAHPANRRQ